MVLYSSSDSAHNPFFKVLKSSWIFPVWFWLTITAFSALKIWLIQAQHLFAIGPADKDDRLFINLANSLIHHQWLGPYNSMTLAKGPFFSFWLYLNHLIGLPLLTTQHLFYLLACVVMTIALRPVMQKNWQSLILFLALLFNPITLNAPLMTRVIREGIYISLTLLVVATSVGLLLRSRRSARELSSWSFGAGVALTSLWLTREEGVWILPTVLLLVAAFIFTAWRSRQANWWQTILWAGLPFLMLGGAICSLSLINLRQYGIFATVEYKSAAFLDAYGAMTRVKSNAWYPYVPVTKEARLKMYAVSPTFATVRPYLDAPNNPWIKISNENTGQNIPEIAGGWFMWSFRDTVDEAGHYRDGRTALNFYRSMAAEINQACDTGQLDCLPKRSTMISPWRGDYLKPLQKEFWKAWPYMLKFEGLSAVSPISTGDQFSLDLFSRVTNETIYSNPTPDQRVSIAINIIAWHKNFLPLVGIGTVAATSLLLVRRKNRVVIWIIFAILSSVVVRVTLLSFISVSSFPSNNWLYLGCLYPLITLIVLLPILSLATKSPQPGEGLPTATA